MQTGILILQKQLLSKLTQLSALLFSLHTKPESIKLHIVTDSGISAIIITCSAILSLFNPVLIFKIAFISSALILFLNLNFTAFVWPNICSISPLTVLQPLRWRCVDCVIHRERDVHQE